MRMGTDKHMTIPPISMPPHLIGQGQSEQIFLNLYNCGRTPHAFLLTGPQGVGKCGMAFRMARALLQGETPLQHLDFDPGCVLSQKIQGLSHPDLRFLYKGYSADGSENVSGMIKTDDIRTSIAFTVMTPSDSQYRILIINDCHMIAPNGQNALLKTLEEPGKHTAIILTTHMPQAILATIKSRCVKIALNVLSTDHIVQVLQQKFPQTDDRERESYAHIANGSLGDAVSYVEHQALSLYQLLMDALYKGADAVYTLCAEVSPKKQAELFDILCKLWQYFGNKIVLAHAQNTPLQAVLPSEHKGYEKIVATYQRQQLLDWVDRVSQSLQHTKAPLYLDKKLVILTAFLPLHT